MPPSPHTFQRVRISPPSPSEKPPLEPPVSPEPNLDYPDYALRSTPSFPCPIWGALAVPPVPSGEPLPAHQYKLSRFSSALAASRDSPKSLSPHLGPLWSIEGKPCLGSQFVASPPLCVQTALPVSLTLQPLSDSDWSGGNLVPDAAGSQ